MFILTQVVSRSEYKKAHWWVRYDEKAGIGDMFCSVLYVRSGLKYLREIMCTKSGSRLL